MTNWISPEVEQPPRDGTLIIAEFGNYPATVACWSDAIEQWTVAELQIGMYNGLDDQYFETVQEHDENLVRWMPMPKTEAMEE